jgi:very-short-patch-repair endonuclease
MFVPPSSIPQTHLAQYSGLLQRLRNRGRAALFAYLMYAKAVSDDNHELRQGILAELSEHCSEKHYATTDLGAGSESPFEEEVYAVLTQHIGENRVTQQYKLGGFRIDMVICSKITGKPTIALECDGAKYHSSPEAYAWDLFRQDQLEKYGLVFHRIWSTKWWDAADRETTKLLNVISAHDAREASAHVKYI